jgi:hypothetical protein
MVLDEDVVVAFIYMISFGEYIKIGKTKQFINLKFIRRLTEYEGVFKICVIHGVDPAKLDGIETQIIDTLEKTFKRADASRERVLLLRRVRHTRDYFESYSS